MILKLPDWLGDIIRPNPYAETLSISRWVLFIHVQKWHVPNANDTFTTSGENETAFFSVVRRVRTSDCKDGPSVTSESEERLKELARILIVFLDIFHVPKLDLAVFGGCCEDIITLREVHTPNSIKMCFNIVLGFDEFGADLSFQILFSLFQYGGLAINNFDVFVGVVL